MSRGGTDRKQGITDVKIIICGAGQVGRGIAERLAAEDNAVTVIDTSPELVRTISEELDVQGIVGHGAHPDVLEQAGAQEADMIIAVTFTDEVNMVACEVANVIFNIPTKIARVRHQSYLEPQYSRLFSRENTAIDKVISPEITVGDMVLRRLALPGAQEAVPFAGGKVIALGMHLDEDCPLLDTPLMQLADLFPDLKAVVVGIWRRGEVIIPHGDTQMEAGDFIFVIADQANAQRVLALFGHDDPPARNVIIAGGGNIGFYVARRLEETSPGAHIRIIENDRARAELIADSLQRSIVLHGSALDSDILREADAERADVYIALTNDDKVNLLSSLLARREGAAHTMSLISTLKALPLVEPLGIDSWIDPRAATVSEILRHVRQGRIRGVYPVFDGAAEIVEGTALETSPMVGKKLKEAPIPEGIRIGAVIRGDEVLTVSGDLEIHAGDTIVLLATARAAGEIQHLFRVSLEYF
jgi:trk system potassium uptake protein TrkA